MDDFASDLINPPRWNSWFRVSPVQFEGEEHPISRGARLCCLLPKRAIRFRSLKAAKPSQDGWCASSVRFCMLHHRTRTESGAQSLATPLELDHPINSDSKARAAFGNQATAIGDKGRRVSGSIRK